MLPIAVILTVLACLVTLIWSSRHLMISRERRTGFVLRPECPGPPAQAPRITVVVAAKDEEHCIASCVQSMLDQDYGNFEVLVCNDRSADRTGEIVKEIAKGDQRLRLVNIERLPDGWCGKNNAMHTGIATSDSPWICMIDADCRQVSRRTLSVAMQHALDAKADMLSVLPVLEMRGFWENVVQPVCGGVMMIWFHPDRVNDPKRPNAYANGAFMLMRREVYEAVGGHEAVKDKVNEDMHMADRVKKAGHRLRVCRSEGLYLSRMYTSLDQIVRGWSRIFFGTFCTLRRLGISLALMTLMGPLPYIAAAVGLGMWAAGATGHAWWAACGLAGLAATAIQFSVIYRFFGLAGGKPWLFWTYPLGSGVTIWALVQGLGKLRRGAKVVWRNTSYTTPGNGK